jgi:hypothetical protein
VDTPTPAPAPSPAPAGPGDGGRALTDTAINQIVWDLIKDVSFASRNVIETIYAYIEKMRPGLPIDPDQGARHQLMLFKALNVLLNTVEGDFDATYRAALKLIEAHLDGVFAQTHRYRFLDRESLPMTDEQKSAFQRIVHVMTTTAPVQGREQALKQLNLEAAFKFGVTEAGKNRLFGFYGK